MCRPKQMTCFVVHSKSTKMTFQEKTRLLERSPKPCTHTHSLCTRNDWEREFSSFFLIVQSKNTYPKYSYNLTKQLIRFKKLAHKDTETRPTFSWKARPLATTYQHQHPGFTHALSAKYSTQMYRYLK